VNRHLKHYVTVEKLDRAKPGMFGTTKYPHEKAAQDTLTRYVWSTLTEAGIGTDRVYLGSSQMDKDGNVPEVLPYIIDYSAIFIQQNNNYYGKIGHEGRRPTLP
jgi:hypothetical protein